MIDLTIRGATVVTSGGRRRAHVSVAGGRIAAISEEPLPAREEIDAEGLLLLPGMVDGHVHFQEPGDTTREDFATGSAAAAVGGVTTVIEHTHSDPVRDVRELDEKVAHLRGRSVVDFGLAAHAWPDRISEVPALWAAGVAFFKVFTCATHGVPGFDRAALRALLLEVARAGALCLIHAEDEGICAANERALRSAGRSDGRVIPEWRSREAELAALATVAELVRDTGARAAVAHVSHAAAVDLLANAQDDGARLWIETCPQYLLLREDEIEEQGALRKFTPPARARSDADLDEMWRRVADGPITHISTDHAPSTRAQKLDRSIWDAPFGLPGVETTLPLLIDAAISGRLSLERVAELTSEAPARLYGQYPRKGSLDLGADADLVLVDPSAERVLRDEDVVSKAGWTPYAGRLLRGWIVRTFVRGRLVARDARPVAEPGWGTYLSNERRAAPARATGG